MKLDKPLSEGAMASVSYGMRVTSKANNALYDIEQELKHCKIKIDPESFANARFHLDKLYAQLTPIPLAHAQAKARA